MWSKSLDIAVSDVRQKALKLETRAVHLKTATERLIMLRSLSDGQIRAININRRFLDGERNPVGFQSENKVQPVELFSNGGIEIIRTFAKSGEPLANKILNVLGGQDDIPEADYKSELSRLISGSGFVSRLLLRKMTVGEYEECLNGDLVESIRKWDEFHAKKLQLHKNIRKNADKAASQKDYGAAFFYITLYQVGEMQTGYWASDVAEATKARELIWGMMRSEFFEIAKKEKIKITDGNAMTWFKEYSPSWTRYQSLSNDFAECCLANGELEIGKLRAVMAGITIEDQEAESDLAYLIIKIPEIIGWERFKGDAGIDVFRCFGAISYLADELGETNDPVNTKRMVEMLKAKLALIHRSLS